jgi:putative transposase
MALPPQEIRTFFVTFVAAQRRRLFQTDRNSSLFMDVMTGNMAKGRMQIHAFVLMPDHVHLLLMPAPDVSLEKAIQFLKGGFSFRLKSKMNVWERSFLEHRITNAADYANHVAYVEQNPVRAGLVGVAEKFKFSSAADRGGVDPAPSHLGRG